jgi:putative ABC transport system substrate-binding protein
MAIARHDKWRFVLIVLVILAGLTLAGCGAAADTDGDSGEYRVGLLSGVDTFNSVFDGFKAKMAELGYIEGENIVYDFQAAGGDSEKMKQIAEKFVADEVDLILTSTTGGAKAAQAATAGTDIPVIFTIVTDPAGTGLVDDLREPGGNMTGVARQIEAFLSKRVEFLGQMAPDVERVWLPYNPDYPTAKTSLPAIRSAASVVGMELVETPVGSPDEVIAALEQHGAADELEFEAIMIVPDTTVQNQASWEAIQKFTEEHQVPIVAQSGKQVKDGALFGYIDSSNEAGKLAASPADKILRGADPATIPVAFGEPQLLINYKVAQTLGLDIAEGLLAQASEIIR